MRPYWTDPSGKKIYSQPRTQYRQEIRGSRCPTKEGKLTGLIRKSDQSAGSWKLLIRFLMNSKAEKKMALMMHERAIETLSPIHARLHQLLLRCWTTVGTLLTSIHPSVEELDLRHLDGLTSGHGQTVTLVVSFGGIDRIYLNTSVSLARSLGMIGG